MQIAGSDGLGASRNALQGIGDPPREPVRDEQGGQEAEPSEDRDEAEVALDLLHAGHDAPRDNALLGHGEAIDDLLHFSGRPLALEEPGDPRFEVEQGRVVPLHARHAVQGLERFRQVPFLASQGIRRTCPASILVGEHGDGDLVHGLGRLHAHAGAPVHVIPDLDEAGETQHGKPDGEKNCDRLPERNLERKVHHRSSLRKVSMSWLLPSTSATSFRARGSWGRGSG